MCSAVGKAEVASARDVNTCNRGGGVGAVTFGVSWRLEIGGVKYSFAVVEPCSNDLAGTFIRTYGRN